MGPMFNPPVLSKTGGPLAALTLGTTGGGTNWPGAGYDPETHTFYAQANNSQIVPIGLSERPEGFTDIKYVLGTAGQPFRISEGPGFGSAADYPQSPRTRPAAAAPAATPAPAPAIPSTPAAAGAQATPAPGGAGAEGR